MKNKNEKFNYKDRFYRNLTSAENLTGFRAVVKETDLLIYAERPLEKQAVDLIFEQRGYVESYIKHQPEFAASLVPLPEISPSPFIIKNMMRAGQNAGVGPMASIAGAIAEQVGQGLLKFSREVIVENGGDVFIKKNFPFVAGVFAGKSPLSNRVGLRIHPDKKSLAICTSSGTVGHSLSMGQADAVTVKSDSCALADAAATAIGNMVKKAVDIEKAIEFAKTIHGISGLLIIIGDKMGMWGDLELVPI
ncbi:Thiamine biosynthesis protein ApbE [Candidatus Magnetomoraceae bacterium gMMP-15]